MAQYTGIQLYWCIGPCPTLQTLNSLVRNMFNKLQFSGRHLWFSSWFKINGKFQFYFVNCLSKYKFLVIVFVVAIFFFWREGFAVVSLCNIFMSHYISIPQNTSKLHKNIGWLKMRIRFSSKENYALRSLIMMSNNIVECSCC